MFCQRHRLGGHNGWHMPCDTNVPAHCHLHITQGKWELREKGHAQGHTASRVQASQHHLLSQGARTSVWEETLHNSLKAGVGEGKFQAEGTQPNHRGVAGPGCWAAGQQASSGELSAMKIPQGTLVAPYPVAISGQPITRHPWNIPDLLDPVRDVSPEQRGIWTLQWHHLLTLPGTPRHPCTPGPPRRALHPARVQHRILLCHGRRGHEVFPQSEDTAMGHAAGPGAESV